MGLADRATASGGALHRLAQRPMWQHALALLVLLTVLIPVIGTGGQFHDDEGAATLQAHMLAEGEGWLRPYEVHGFDPGYVHPSIFAADLRTAGYAPYGKHPAYPLLLVPFAKVGGVAGLLFTSVLGAVAAALVAGEIGERLRPGSRAVVFWAAALGSPLFFDGLIVEAHTIAAALAGAAVLALFAFFDRPRWTASFAALAALLGVGLLRTEGILFSVAAGIAVILVAIWRHRRAAVTLGAGLVVLGAAIRLLEPRAAGAVLPSTAAHVRDHLRAGGTFVSRRVAGAVTGLVQGGYQWVSVGFALSTLAAVLLLATIVVARRRPADTDGIALFAFAAAAVFVLRALIASSGAIPGLLLTSPIIVAGLAFVRCRSFTSDRHRLSVTLVVLYALAVLATQYGIAGATEWGWRYFALALPVVVPLAVDVTWSAVERLDRRARLAIAGAITLGSVALFAVGIGTLISDHRESADQAAMVVRQLDAGIAGPRGQALVVSTFPPLGRYAWRDLDAGRFTIVFHQDLAVVAPQLAQRGIDQMLFVTDDVDRDIGVIRASFDDVQAVDDRAGVTVFVVAGPHPQ